MSFFNFSDFLNPPKRSSNVRSPTIPFCTSPSQLQEVTLDHDATFSSTMGLRSPGGPMRGRSVKEFEEQLANLKKENFNLKLRIYFLEEKMGTNFTLDKDNVVKKNIELQVEIANLQKEVQEKHELLCQAVKAMELEDEEHKKFIAAKEDQLLQYQQELDDVRIQLQDTKIDSDGNSLKSDTTGFYSSRATNSGNLITELHEKMRLMETELQLEKENNASLQIILGQAETLKCRYESMQIEFQAKDETIRNLTDEIEAANDRILSFTDQVTKLQEKLEASQKENQLMQKKMQTENKKFEEVMSQINDLKKKYAMAKVELEREHKRAERVKAMSEEKVSELEDENEKQKMKIRDLQAKLEAALVEIKKNQNLAVSKSPVQKSNTPNTDDNSFSVSDPAAPAGAPKANSLHVPITPQHKSPISSPTSPEKFSIKDFEQMLRGAGECAGSDKILSQFQLINHENTTLKQKIVKLKGEQMKACEIIKNMIESRNKATGEINQLKKHNEELEHELESVVSKPSRDGIEVPLQQRVASMNITAANPDDEKSMAESQLEDIEIAEHYKALIIELEAKIEILVATVNEKDAQMQKIREQHEEILTNLEDKENRIVDLEFELLAIQKDDSKTDISILEKGDNGSEKHSSYYRLEMEEKDKEIEKLSVELKKCTCYLQEIVNTELWERNKEIEKLHNKHANSSEVQKLRKDLTGKELQLKLLKEKISELGLDISIPSEDTFDNKDFSSQSKNIQHIKTLQEQLKSCKEERDYFREKVEEVEGGSQTEQLKELQAQNDILQREIEKSEKLRHESNEICSVLSGRLEELAIFLDSLLKQKSVLGFLGVHKNRKLREIIDNSLDLSRSFTMSMMINPDQSLAQLSNITALLNGSVFQDLTLDFPHEEEAEAQSVLSIMPANVTLTYQSHLYKQKNKGSEPNNEQVISALREQIVNLKSELQLRDNELSRLNNTNNKEESEKTTETDCENENKSCSGFKDVSKLFTTPTKSTTTSTTLKAQADCQSESETWSEPDRVISRTRMGLSSTLPISLKHKENVSESTEEESCSSSHQSKMYWADRRMSVKALHERIYDLEEKLKKTTVDYITEETKLLDNNRVYREQVDELERKLTEVEDKYVKAEAKKIEAENQVKSLQQKVIELMNVKKNLEESVAAKDKETQNRINQLEVEREEASRIAQDYEKEVTDARNEIKVAENKVKNMQDELSRIEGNLRKEYEQYTIVKLKDAEEEFVKKLREVEEKSEQKLTVIRDEYSRDFVPKSEVEAKLSEADSLVSKLDDLKSSIKSYEEIIEGYKEKENKLLLKLHESQDKINILHKELDNTTLQYSEAVLEKTKLANEKTLLEQQLSKINVKESDMQQQFNDMQQELTSVSQNHQQHISMMQQQKSKLEVKISELESSNAELHNKLVRLRASRTSDCNSSLPNIDSRNVQVLAFQRQFSEQNYSSEENIAERGVNFNRPLMHNIQPVDMERLEANSSPDLGIESDHGRFSSLETHATITRPLLQTIELTESMSNLLDGENNQVEGVICESEHCCQKTLEIAHENNDLKRKLLRMRRALEETANQLNLANQRKKQVEKTICKQIHKTSQVLRKAKANLDSGSESDMRNKM